MIINTKADYEAAPKHEQQRFRAAIAASVHRWKWNGAEWELKTDYAQAEAFGLSKKSLPDIKPEKPDYNPDERAREQLAADIRAERDRLIATTDYAVQPDSPHDTPEMRAYRQALRDVPQQEGFPDSVEWPEKP